MTPLEIIGASLVGGVVVFITAVKTWRSWKETKEKRRYVSDDDDSEDDDDDDEDD